MWRTAWASDAQDAHDALSAESVAVNCVADDWGERVGVSVKK